MGRHRPGMGGGDGLRRLRRRQPRRPHPRRGQSGAPERRHCPGRPGLEAQREPDTRHRARARPTPGRGVPPAGAGARDHAPQGVDDGAGGPCRTGHRAGWPSGGSPHRGDAGQRSQVRQRLRREPGAFRRDRDSERVRQHRAAIRVRLRVGRGACHRHHHGPGIHPGEPDEKGAEL